MNKQGMYNPFQLINAMYEYRSLIITTNKDFTSWGEFFFDDNVAIPVVDRIIHHSHIFMLGGESYRLKSKPGNEISLRVVYFCCPLTGMGYFNTKNKPGYWWS